MSQPRPKIFVSYSHKDEPLKDELVTHLSVLQDAAGLVNVWDDHRINAGEDWQAEIEQAMNETSVAILLISANFLTSNFILQQEVPQLLERRQKKGMAIVPVLAKSCVWEKVPWLNQMQIRPRDAKPVWREGGQYADEELKRIVEEVDNLIRDKQERIAEKQVSARLLSSEQVARLPTGTVTFLLTDIENSTLLQDREPEVMKEAVERHEQIIKDLVEQYEGVLVKKRGEGDSTFSVFTKATNAIEAAYEIQKEFFKERWPTQKPIRIRIGIHAGDVEERNGDYYELVVTRCARLKGIADGGQTFLSAVVKGLVQGKLPKGVELEGPSSYVLKGLSEPEQVFQLIISGLPYKPLSPQKRDIPQASTHFIGREAEIAKIKDFISKNPLVTLTGTGGVGKTRLAKQIAGDIKEVAFIELASSPSTSVIQIVARVLGLHEEQQLSLQDTIIASLRTKPLLLILDNCEHLIEECATLIDILLRSCPQLRILATSRWPLKLSYEQPFSVPLLQISEAIQLFEERAGRISTGPHLTATDNPDIEEICEHLDRLPLMIELAAGHINLGVSRLKTRLFEMLVDDSHDRPKRHKKLEDVVNWSYHLLEHKEQILFNRLSVFVNGWTLEAAIEVCANGELLATEVEDLLIQLATKSLIVAEYKDSQLDRYKMLETIRECARKKLADQSVAIEKRMVEYYIQYAAQHQRNYLSLEQEWDNLFTSMRWVYQQKQWQSVIEFSQALTEAWFARGRYAEARQGYQWAYEGVELLGNRLVMAEMLYLQARSYSRQRNYLLAAPLAQEALDIQKQENDQQGSVLTLHLLANITLYGSRDFILAEQYCQQALALCEKLKDQGRQAEVLYVLAQVHSQQDDFRSAQKYAEESLRIFRLLNRRPAQATVLDYLILVYRGLGDYTSAQQVGEASLELFQQLGNEWATIQVLRDQGKLLKDMGQIEQACSKWTEALSIAKRLPDHPLTSELQTLLNTHCA